MVEVRDQPERMRYEIALDGALAGFAQYVRKADRVIFVHTEIDDAYGGQGLGGRLAQGALDDVCARGLRAVPLCPFIAAFIEKHPEYADLVDADALAALER